MCNVLMTALRHAQERIEVLESEQYMSIEEFGEPLNEQDAIECSADMGIMIGSLYGTPMYRFDVLCVVSDPDGDEVCNESVH